MEVVKSKNFKEPIVLVKILDDNSLVVVDSKTTIRYLNKESLALANGFKANIHHQRYKTNVVAFSSDGKKFASLSADSRESRLYDAQKKKAIAKVDRHQGEASCVGIDNANKYMFSCGDDGKTFAIDIESKKLAFTLPPHADTLNDIAFSSNKNWIATCSYDRKISIFHLAMMTPKHKLKAHAAPVMKITFIAQNRLFSVDNNNKAIIWNIYSAKVIERLSGIHDDVTQVTTAEDYQFLFLGTALGYVLVYDLKTYKQLSSRYIKCESTITALTYDAEDKNLIIACENGDLLFYNIYEGEDHIQELLKQQKYNDIHAYIEVNPILEYSKVYQLVLKFWETTLKKAKQYLQNNDRETAINLLNHFKNIPEKNKIIQNVLNQYKEYGRFVELAKQGRIVLAYGLANQYPLYKESPIYKSLEARWQKAFALAQKYSLEPRGIDKAREILAPYRGLSDKTKLIQELFTKGKVYKRFQVAIAQKEFLIAFKLIKLHPFLKEFPEYLAIINYGDTLYIKSQELIKAGYTHAAIKLLRILKDFPDFADETNELMREMEAEQKFLSVAKSEDLISAYNMLDESDDLQNTEAGKALQETWNKDLKEANSFAVDGNAEGVKEALKDYMSINSKYMSIGMVFSWSYMTQIEQAMQAKKPQSVVENGIKNYILYFGLQDQILSLYDVFKSQYPESKLNLELLTKGDLSMWRPSMIVNSILE